jgi:DNA-binding IclR family transcriptional regulator/AraC-like DNA-binding protein
MNRDSLTDAALPVMRKLHDLFGETVGLAVLDTKAGKGLIVESVQGTRHRFSFTLTPGTRFPLHTGAPAKAIVAFLPADRQERMLAALELKRFTKQTITTKKAFRKELAVIRGCGYALDRSEEIEGCHCVAAPVFDAEGKVVAAVWITGPSSRLSLRDLHAAAPGVIAAAGEITGALNDRSAPDTLAPNDALVQRTVRHLEEHLAEKIDWHRLAADFGASYSKLRHLFAERTGVSPSRHHLNLRIEAAKRLLRESEMPVLEIAEKTGFSDPNHFSAIFSRKVGVPPTRYRSDPPPR